MDNTEQTSQNSTSLPWIPLLIVGALIGVALATYLVWSPPEPHGAQPAEGEAGAFTAAPVSDTGEIRIALADLADGRARFYEHAGSDGEAVRFFVVKSPDGGYRAALDACETCYHAGKGYTQTDEEMLCRHCGLTFPPNEINETSGGCAPIGIERVVEGDHLVLQADQIVATNARYADGAGFPSSPQ